MPVAVRFPRIWVPAFTETISVFFPADVGSNIHVAVFSSLIGAGHISIGDFANISSRVSIFSSSDDYSGEYMTNPTVPEAYTNVTRDPVKIGRHAIVGCGSIILPGVTLEDGVAVGALSLVNSDCAAFTVCAGVPVREIRKRKRNLLDHEQRLLASLHV